MKLRHFFSLLVGMMLTILTQGAMGQQGWVLIPDPLQLTPNKPTTDEIYNVGRDSLWVTSWEFTFDPNFRVFTVGGPADGVKPQGREVFVRVTYTPTTPNRRDTTMVIIALAWRGGATAADTLVVTGEALSTDVETDAPSLPNDFALHQNYPNPFNPTTIISYSLPSSQHVTLKVYNVLGAEVATLVNGEVGAGKHEVNFDASKFQSGIYFYRLQTGAHIEVRKMQFVK